MIGHPLEKLFIEPPKIGELDIKLGRDTFPFLSLEPKTQWYTLPYHELPKEVMSVLPFESPKLSLDKDAKLFIEEKDDLGETINLPKEEVLA